MVLLNMVHVCDLAQNRLEAGKRSGARFKRAVRLQDNSSDGHAARPYNGVGKPRLGFGPAGANVVLTGIDVLVTKGDWIDALYTFIDPTVSSSV